MNTIKENERLLFRFCCRRSSPIPSTRYWMINDNGEFFSNLDQIVKSFQKKHPEVSEKQAMFYLKKFQKLRILQFCHVHEGDNLTTTFCIPNGWIGDIKTKADRNYTVISFNFHSPKLSPEYVAQIPKRCIRLQCNYSIGYIGELDISPTIIMKIFKEFRISTIYKLLSEINRIYPDKFPSDKWRETFTESELKEMVDAVKNRKWRRIEWVIRVKQIKTDDGFQSVTSIIDTICPQYQPLLIYKITNLDDILKEIDSIRKQDNIKNGDSIFAVRGKPVNSPYVYFRDKLKSVPDLDLELSMSIEDFPYDSDLPLPNRIYGRELADRIKYDKKTDEELKKSLLSGSVVFNQFNCKHYLFFNNRLYEFTDLNDKMLYPKLVFYQEFKGFSQEVAE